MPYVLNTQNGKIHDVSKPHIRNKVESETGGKYELFDTIQEAKAIAIRYGKIPSACRKCYFPEAVVDEMNS